MKIRLVGAQLSHADEEADRHDKENSRFLRNCEKRPTTERVNP